MTCPSPRGSTPFRLWPSSFNAILQSGPRHPETACNRRHRLAFALVGDKLCSTLVNLLHLWGRPTAVLRTIIAVIVYPIQCMADGPFAHIREKILKRLPSFTDLDSPRSVRGEFRRFGVATSVAHLSPRVVSVGLFSVGRMAMFRWPRLSGARPRTISPSACKHATAVGFKYCATLRASRRYDRVLSWHRHSLCIALNFIAGKYLGRFKNATNSYALSFQQALDAGGWA